MVGAPSTFSLTVCNVRTSISRERYKHERWLLLLPIGCNLQRVRMRLLYVALILAGCGSTSLVTPPDDDDRTTPADIVEANEGDMTSTSTTLVTQEQTGSEDAPVGTDSAATTTAVPSGSDSHNGAVDDGEVSANDGNSSPTSTPRIVVDPDTVEPEAPELFTEEPSDNSGLFGTEEPGSSA